MTAPVKSQSPTTTPVVVEKEQVQNTKPVVVETLSSHEQTASQKEQAKAQFEKFSRESSPARITTETKEKVEETAKTEAVQEVTQEQLQQINAIQELVLKSIMADQKLKEGINGVLTDPTKIPIVQECLEKFENALTPEAKALHTHLLNASAALINQCFGNVDAMKLAVEIGVRRALTDKITPCEEKIRTISPEYLKRLASVDSKPIGRVAQLTAAIEQLPNEVLAKLPAIFLLEGDEQETELVVSFGEAVPPAVKEAIDYLKEIEDANTRAGVLDGLMAAIQERLT